MSPALLQPLDTRDPAALDYCLQLARGNMQPYLDRRGQTFDQPRWCNYHRLARLYAINLPPTGQRIGFLALRPDWPEAGNVHLSDLQLEPAHQRRGHGGAALRQAIALARALGGAHLSLNVFPDNPALALYRRHGFSPQVTGGFAALFGGQPIPMRRPLEPLDSPS